MNKLLSTVFAFALCFSSCHEHSMHAATMERESEPAKVAGKWQLSVDTPHGLVTGLFQVQQDGAKLTATFEAENHGSFSLTGSVDGGKVSFILNLPGGTDTFTFSGTLDGSKMSGETGMGGAWSATRQ